MYLKFNKIFLAILLFGTFGCNRLSYRLTGYYEISFEGTSVVQEIRMDNRKIEKNQKYYVNKAIHRIDWKEKEKNYTREIFINKSGRYYIGENRIYYLNRNIEVINY